jgi:hypothetical protein
MSMANKTTMTNDSVADMASDPLLDSLSSLAIKLSDSASEATAQANILKAVQQRLQDDALKISGQDAQIKALNQALRQNTAELSQLENSHNSSSAGLQGTEVDEVAQLKKANEDLLEELKVANHRITVTIPEEHNTNAKALQDKISGLEEELSVADHRIRVTIPAEKEAADVVWKKKLQALDHELKLTRLQARQNGQEKEKEISELRSHLEDLTGQLQDTTSKLDGEKKETKKSEQCLATGKRKGYDGPPFGRELSTQPEHVSKTQLQAHTSNTYADTDDDDDDDDQNDIPLPNKRIRKTAKIAASSTTSEDDTILCSDTNKVSGTNIALARPQPQPKSKASAANLTGKRITTASEFLAYQSASSPLDAISVPRDVTPATPGAFPEEGDEDEVDASTPPSKSNGGRMIKSKGWTDGERMTRTRGRVASEGPKERMEEMMGTAQSEVRTTKEMGVSATNEDQDDEGQEKAAKPTTKPIAATRRTRTTSGKAVPSTESDAPSDVTDADTNAAAPAPKATAKPKPAQRAKAGPNIAGVPKTLSRTATSRGPAPSAGPSDSNSASNAPVPVPPPRPHQPSPPASNPVLDRPTTTQAPAQTPTVRTGTTHPPTTQSPSQPPSQAPSQPPATRTNGGTRHAWTAADDAVLLAGRAAGKSYAQIGREVGRTTRACTGRMCLLSNRGGGS